MDNPAAQDPSVPLGEAAHERTLREMNEALLVSSLRQHELAEVARKAEAALVDQAKHKDEFLAMLAHELRNPLAPIRSATYLLRLEGKGKQTPTQDRALEVIERQVTTLTRLISDLMEVSRAFTGRIRIALESVDINQTLRNALETVRPIMDSRGHTLTSHLCSDPIWANIDAVRMEEVFVNLLTNASKYTDEGGLIDLRCESNAGFAVVRVADNGNGIDAELLPRIFDLFSQGERTLDRSQGGLGIGLSLAQRLVKLHGGTLEALSGGPGKGSEFIVRLPLSLQTSLPVPEIKLETAHSQGLRVLIADDNEDACVMLGHVMQSAGHGVRTAFTGAAALSLAESWLPDVLLMDIGLPELDGYEVARRLRACPPTRGIKLVAITGYGSERDMVLGREAGFDAYLVKPVDIPDVERLLKLWSPAPPA